MKFSALSTFFLLLVSWNAMSACYYNIVGVQFDPLCVMQDETGGPRAGDVKIVQCGEEYKITCERTQNPCNATLWRLEEFKRCNGNGGGYSSPQPNPNVSSNNPSKACGSVINVDDRIYSESVPLAGISFELVYSSDKVLGRKSWYQADIPVFKLSQGTDHITSAKVFFEIDGVLSSQLASKSSSHFKIHWDAKGRNRKILTGVTSAKVEVLYKGPETDAFSGNIVYDNAGKVSYVGTGISGSFTALPQANFPMGSIFTDDKKLGGWTPSILQQYDNVRGILFLGDGSTFNTIDAGKANGERWVVSKDRSEVYVFDSIYRHLRTLNGITGSVVHAFSYDSNSRLLSVADAYGKLTTFQYGPQGLESITSPWGQVTLITLNSDGYMASLTSPAGHTHHMTYTQDGLLLSFQKPTGAISNISYNADGYMISDTNSFGSEVNLARTTTEYGYITSESSALGIEKTGTITFEGGMKRIDTIPGLIKKEYTSNEASETWKSDLQFLEQINYGNDPRFSGSGKFKTAHKFTNFGVELNHQFSENGQLANPADPFSFSQLIQNQTVNGKVYSNVYNKSLKSWISTTPEGRVTETVLNSQGDAVSTKLASLQAITKDYNQLGQLTKISQGSDRNVDITYNPTNGQISTVQNALGQTTSYEYDLAGRVTSQVLPDSRVIGFDYDENGNLTGVTPPQKPKHEMMYNGINLLTSYLPPTIAAPTGDTSYIYNLDKQLTHMNRPEGTVQYVYYTTNGTLNKIQHSGKERIFYPPGTYGQNIISSNYSEDYVICERVKSAKLVYSDHCYEAVGFRVNYTYDNNFNVTQENFQIDGPFSIVNYSYDNDGLVTAAGQMSLERDLHTGVVKKTILNNIIEDYSYSSSYGEFSKLETLFKGNQIYKEIVTRDNLGRIITRSERYPNGSLANYSYIYDDTGRLTQVNSNGSPKVTYSYDSNSNRIGQVGDCEEVKEDMSEYDDHDRLIRFGNLEFTYNRNGDVRTKTNTTTNETTTYTFDLLGGLKQVQSPNQTISYKVDSFGNRVVKTVGSKKTYYGWLNGRLYGMQEGTAPIQSKSHFVYATKSHVPDYMIRSGVTYKITTDHLGSPVVVVNASTGAVAQTVKYDEFGKIIADSNPGFTPFGFAGCLYDQDTKLCRFGVRDYDASIGRWLSKDPIMFQGGDTNLYGYVLQDPVNFIDPTGEIPIAPIMIGIIFGFDLINSDVAKPDFSNGKWTPKQSPEHLKESDKYFQKMMNRDKKQCG